MIKKVIFAGLFLLFGSVTTKATTFEEVALCIAVMNADILENILLSFFNQPHDTTTDNKKITAAAVCTTNNTDNDVSALFSLFEKFSRNTDINSSCALHALSQCTKEQYP